MRAPDGVGSRSRGSAKQGRVCLGCGRLALQGEGPWQAGQAEGLRQTGNKTKNNQCAQAAENKGKKDLASAGNGTAGRGAREGRYRDCVEGPGCWDTLVRDLVVGCQDTFV